MCKFTEFAKDTSVGVSVFTLTALSADRYFAIVHSVRKRVSGSKSKRVICSIVFIWTLAVGLATPGALFSHIMSFDIGNTTNETTFIQVCYPFPSDFGPNYPKVVVMVKALTHFIVPVLISDTFYSIIGITYYAVQMPSYANQPRIETSQLMEQCGFSEGSIITAICLTVANVTLQKMLQQEPTGNMFSFEQNLYDVCDVRFINDANIKAPCIEISSVRRILLVNSAF
jgi:7 transmembrane receptor (rhodopsin family)